MTTQQSRALRFIIPITIALISYFVSITLVERYYAGDFVRWMPLGKPPTAIAEIWAVDLFEPMITVQTVDGKFFRALPNQCQQATDCWQEQPAAEQDMREATTLSQQCQSDFSRMVPPPAPSVQCASILYFGADVIDEGHFAVLGDGSVWFWHFAGGGLSFPLFNLGFLFPCATVLLGLLLGYILTLALQRRFSERQAHSII